MKKIQLGHYPGGKIKAVTLSYDDGQIHDRRLVEIMNKYGVKGTFHLNSSRIGQEGVVTFEELNTLYKGHEISLHTCSHPSLAMTPPEVQIEEIMQDRKILEKATGQIVNGLSYPGGSVSGELIERLRNLGILYSRTTVPTYDFKLPEEFLHWNPTMHHSKMYGATLVQRNNIADKEILMSKAKEFAERSRWYYDMPLFYLWGHSYEFENDDTWDLIEGFCKYMADNSKDIWFATNMEVYNYVQALKALRFSADCSIVYNPTAIDVWITVEYEPFEIKAGQTVTI